MAIQIINGRKHKQCSNCQRTFLLYKFSFCKANSDGYADLCKICAAKEKTIQQRELNKVKNRKLTRTELKEQRALLAQAKIRKLCARCYEKLPINQFYKHPNSVDKLSSYCKRCSNEYSKNHQQSGFEEIERAQRKVYWKRMMNQQS